MTAARYDPRDERFIAVDVERMVLGSIVSSAEAWDAVSDTLTAAAFTGPCRPGIFETVAVHYREGSPGVLDFSLVVEAVRSQLALAKAGGIEEVREAVLAATTLPTLVQQGVRKLHDLRAQREARGAAAAFLARDVAENAERELSDFQRQLAAIETGRAAPIVTAGELISTMLDELEAEHAGNPGTELISTGFPGIDQAVGGFERGILHLYASRPGVGKSGLAIAYASALGAAGIPTAVFWWEDTARKFALRMAAGVGEIPAAILRHGKSMHAPYWERLTATADQVSRWPVYVEATKGLTASQAAQRMRRLRREKGVQVFIADHLGEIRFEERTDRTDMALGEAAGIFRDESERLGACPVLFHQLGQKSETEKGEPRLGWLFNSDVLGQKARVVGFISRDGLTVKIHFVKATYGQVGTTVELAWNAETMRIFQPVPPAQRSFA